VPSAPATPSSASSYDELVEVAMPLYLTRFSYTPETWSRLAQKPEDRQDAARMYIEAVDQRAASISIPPGSGGPPSGSARTAWKHGARCWWMLASGSTSTWAWIAVYPTDCCDLDRDPGFLGDLADPRPVGSSVVDYVW
jgi:hypothetical protein